MIYIICSIYHTLHPTSDSRHPICYFYITCILFFVSISLNNKQLCRCGRKLEGTHTIKCLQNGIIKYSENVDDDETMPEDSTRAPNIPLTTNALNGFYRSKYWNLERSTNHVSTKSFLKHKITDQIYENIIIG